MVLQGTEVKSIREGRVNLKDSYGLVKNGEIWLLNCHISPYSHLRLTGVYAADRSSVWSSGQPD